jgi:hypothetical protein
LSANFLLNDLTLNASDGFGDLPLDIDLVYTIPEPSTGTFCG